MTTKEQVISSIDAIDDTCFSMEMSIYNTLADVYVKSLLIMENYYGDDIDNFSIIQEGNILDKATGKGKDENILTKIVKFIPRLIGALIDAIKNAIKNFRRKRADKSVDKIIINSDPKGKELLEKALKEIGCVGTVDDGVLSVDRIEAIEKDLAIEFKDDVKFKISESGLMKVVFPYYKIDQIIDFNKDINIKIIDIKKMFNKQNYDKLVKALKELDLTFKGIATNQANIKEKSFKDINAWNDYMNTVLDTFNTFSERLSSIKKMFDDMDADIDDMKTPLGSLVDDIKKLLSKTPKDIKLITELDKTIHEVYNVLTDASADKSKYEDFLYVIPDTKNLVNLNNFDNHHIIAAINKFNDFYKNEIIKNAGKDPNVIAKNSNTFKEAINELNKQFNVNIKIDTKIKNRGMYTSPGRMNGGHLTVSKTKGFDLGGAGLIIRSELYEDCIDMIHRSGKMIFGQVMCSSICHEIFHNIAFMMINGNSGPGKIINAINTMATAIFDAKMTIERAVSTFLEKIGIKSETAAYNKLICNMIKNVTYASTDKSLFKKICDKIFDKKIDEVSLREIDGIREIPIDELKKTPINVKKIVSNVLINGILLFFTLTSSVPVPTAIRFTAAIIVGHNIGTMISNRNSVKAHDNEESMADAFAAMYKLPIVFGGTAGQINDGRLRFKANNTGNKGDEHPATYDRSVIGYNMAKEILNSGEKLNPELKEYLEFIVKEFNGVDKVERRYTKDQINKAAPEFNSNINSALNDFIAKHNISVTESSLIYDV